MWAAQAIAMDVTSAHRTLAAFCGRCPMWNEDTAAEALLWPQNRRSRRAPAGTWRAVLDLLDRTARAAGIAIVGKRFTAHTLTAAEAGLA
jgi:hypothetical protein